MDATTKEEMLECLGCAFFPNRAGDKSHCQMADCIRVCRAIRTLIESSVKVTTVGSRLFSHYPQDRAKQTEGSESGGERAAPPADEDGG